MRFNTDLALYTAVLILIGAILVMHSLRDEPLCAPYAKIGIVANRCMGGSK